VTSPEPSPDRAFDQFEVDATLASTLDSLDDAENYRNWIVELASPYLAGPILEVGAGHGTFTEAFAAFGDVIAVEPDAYAAGLLADRYRGDGRVTSLAGVVDDVASVPAFGSAVMINVLEHVADDHAALAAVSDRLRPGGHLVIWVPAFQFLYSRFDEKLGHERRYTKGQLDGDVRRAGYEVVDARYVNMPGWFSWLLMVRLARQEPTSSFTVRVFDKCIVPVVRFIENRIRMPFGQNVLLIARKPG